MMKVIKKDTPVSINEISNKSVIPDDIVTNYVNSCVRNGLLKLSGSDSGETVKLNAEGKSEPISQEDVDCAKKASESCPVQAISV